MASITNIISLKKYLDYIGQGVETIEDEFHPDIGNFYRKKYSTYDNIHTASSEFFIKKFEDMLTNKSLKEFIYHTSVYCFDLIKDKKIDNNSALKALGMIFKNHEDKIKPQHYIFMADQYVKNLEKSQEAQCFFNFFNIDKFNKNYLTCIAIATDDNVLLKKLSKIYVFNQSEYVYSLLHENDLVKSSFEKTSEAVIYGKDIETLFLYKLEQGTLLDLNRMLHAFVHEMKDITSLKNTIKNQEKDRHFKADGMYESIIKTVTINDEIKEMLEHINKYELFLSMTNNLSDKPSIKLNKI